MTLTAQQIGRLLDTGVLTKPVFENTFVDPVFLRRTGHHEKLSCVVLGHPIEWGYTDPQPSTPLPNVLEKMRDRDGYESRVKAVREAQVREMNDAREASIIEHINARIAELTAHERVQIIAAATDPEPVEAA